MRKISLKTVIIPLVTKKNYEIWATSSRLLVQKEDSCTVILALPVLYKYSCWQYRNVSQLVYLAQGL